MNVLDDIAGADSANSRYMIVAGASQPSVKYFGKGKEDFFLFSATDPL